MLSPRLVPPNDTLGEQTVLAAALHRDNAAEPQASATPRASSLERPAVAESTIARQGGAWGFARGNWRWRIFCKREHCQGAFLCMSAPASHTNSPLSPSKARHHSGGKHKNFTVVVAGAFRAAAAAVRENVCICCSSNRFPPDTCHILSLAANSPGTMHGAAVLVQRQALQTRWCFCLFLLTHNHMFAIPLALRCERAGGRARCCSNGAGAHIL